MASNPCPSRSAVHRARLVAGSLAVLLAVPLTAGGAQAAPTRAARPSAVPKAWVACPKGRLDGVAVAVRSTTRSVVTVNQTSRSHARVVLWKRQANRSCGFTKVFTESDARIGAGGTVVGTRRRQGTNTTPLGTYTMTTSFGLAARPATALPYRRVVAGDYWVQDNASRWYNTYRTRAQGGFRTSESENLVTYTTQYRHAVVINYNMPPTAVRHRGAGIFLHVKGRGATGGCVAVTRAHMGTVMATLSPGDLIAIGR
ncbi:L,D-transpeptidase family protein [Luteococcus peritonei]|uniref:L,D-transpeptidase family protein n=1 Tax=Luteococcus peritonei TaxID=88874 RepID=A0ABW4RVP6_9ACTN